MIKDGWAVTHQMLNELDRTPFGPAEQLGEPSLTLDQWHAAQTVPAKPDQCNTTSRPRRRFGSA